MRSGARLAGGLFWILILAAVTTAAADTPEPPQLAGRWGQLHVETAVADVPTVGAVTITTRALVLVEIKQQGASLAIREQVCGVQSASDSESVKTFFPKAFVRRAPVSTRSGQLVHRRGRWELLGPDHVVVYGAELEHPATDPLPTSARDRRVRDADRDGAPGVTIRIDGLIAGDLHLVQRATTSWRALVRSERAIDGLVKWDRQERVLGATNIFLRQELPRRPHPDASKHHFKLRRVAADTTCTALRSQAAQLF